MFFKFQIQLGEIIVWSENFWLKYGTWQAIVFWVYAWFPLDRNSIMKLCDPSKF